MTSGYFPAAGRNHDVAHHAGKAIRRESWLRRHPLIGYFAMVYAISWGGILIVLMHASYTGWLFVLFPAASFEQNLLWQAAFAAGLWILVAVFHRRLALGRPATAV